MASRLETLVSNRAGKKSGKFESLETSSLCQKGARMLETGSSECLDDYREFFANLKTALSVDDHAKSFQLLNHARGIAKELLSRENGAPRTEKMAHVHTRRGDGELAMDTEWAS